MKCEDYKKALIERASVGAKSESKLAGHLEECTECRVKLQHEERLFAAIDDALRTRVSEIPRDGFLAGIQARIREQAPSKSRRIPVWSLAGAVLALALVAMSNLWTSPPRKPVQARRAESLRGPAVLAPRLLESANSAPKTRNSDERVRNLHPSAKHSAGAQIASSEPEVLVPPDEGRALQQFVARLQGHEQVAQAVASPVSTSEPDDKNEFPEIAPVEIARLQLEPLAWENLRDRNRVKIESLCNVITCQSY